MSDALPVLNTHFGGSGNGISKYLSLLGCIERKTRGEAWAAEHDVDLESDEEGTASIGTYFHALMESFYLDKEAAVPYETIANNEQLKEALRLYSYYRQRYHPHEFGKILACELDCPGENSTTAARIADLYEGEAITARFDMVVCLDDDAVDYQKQRNGMELEPGIYIVDHKTKRYSDDMLIHQVAHRTQFHHYQMMWNIANPDMPAKGLIANYAFRYKPDKKTGKIDLQKQFKRFFVPPPSPKEQAHVLSVVRDGARNLRERGEHWKNPLHCFDWFRKCPFLSECDRANV